MIGDILAKLLKVLLGWFTTQNEIPTKADDAPGTPDERDAFERRVREWEAGGVGGPEQNDHPRRPEREREGLRERFFRDMGAESEQGGDS